MFSVLFAHQRSVIFKKFYGQLFFLHTSHRFAECRLLYTEKFGCNIARNAPYPRGTINFDSQPKDSREFPVSDGFSEFEEIKNLLQLVFISRLLALLRQKTQKLIVMFYQYEWKA